MDLIKIKDVINKMEFHLRMAHLDIAAADCNDIPLEAAEKEMKKLAVSLKILCGRLQAETTDSNSVYCDVDEETEDFITEEHVQLSLFPFEY